MDKTKKLDTELESAIKAMAPLLRTASKISHRLELSEADPEQLDFNRMMDLGYLTDGAAGMCSPNLNVLVRVMFALMGGEREEEEVEPRHQHH